MEQDVYERELAPLIRALTEKARRLKSSCLIAVEVQGEKHISGNLINGSVEMQEAFAILFQDEDVLSLPDAKS